MTETTVSYDIYEKESAGVRVEKSRLGCIVALFFMPLGSVVDYVVYPTEMSNLLFSRFICEILLVLIYCLHLTKFAEKYVKLINFSFPAIIVVAMCVIICHTDGINGPYYAGLSMLILGVALLTPLTFPETLYLVVFTVACYLIFGLIIDDRDVNSIIAFNNIYFLSATGIIACASSYFSEKSRFREFQLTYQLDQRNRELFQLDRMKSDFYANISHEFRTPLTLILAPLEDILSRADISGGVKTSLLHVKENTYRLLKLVNDLLDIQKLEEKKDFLEKQPIILNSLLRNICLGMESLAERRSLSLKYESIDSSVVINGDHSAIEKVFINLINNSIKFTEAGGVVTVGLFKDEHGCSIEVRDTGSGIGESDLPYIFDRFRQVDSSMTRKHQGTGLGLALVKELTQLHGGAISVDSTLGEGTTMVVSLPLIESEHVSEILEHADNKQAEMDGLDIFHQNADIQLPNIEHSFSDRSKSSLVVGEPRPEISEEYEAESKPKLLIIEDEPGIRDYLSQTLSDEYNVITAPDGLEGLKLIRTEKPPLVILDLMLPLIDGLSVCEQVKIDEDVWSTRILLLTARTDEKSKLDALKKGADDFLTKPFSTVELKSRITNMWNTSQLQRDVEHSNKELRQTMSELKSTQGNLIQSEKLNALGRLAAGLLHEVNNPLSFAFATFQLLEREPDLIENEYAQDLMKDVRIGMERIAAIVKDLKTFAYPESTDLQANFQLQTAVTSALRFTASKTSRVTIHNLAKDVAIVGSQSHIVQVMVNLLENAADAMESMTDVSPEIVIESKKLSSGRFQVSFTDNGPGISEDVKKQIFDPFYTTKDVGAGMGMGLSICHTIIENHKGVLAVESEVGSFTKFTFDLDDALNALSNLEKSHKDL